MAERQYFGGIGRALSHRYYRRYWYGMLVATAGIWAYRVALGWLVWELTKSPVWLGLVAFTEMVPTIMVGPIAGAYVDRKGVLLVARISQIAWASSAGLLAITTLSGFASKEVLLVFAVLQGCITGLSNPSHLALVAKLVPPQDLSPAIALQSGTVQSGRFIGPAIAGLLLVNYDAGVVFALVSMGLMFFCIILFTLQTVEPEELSRSSKSLMGDFVDGMRYVAGNFPIRIIILYTALMSLLLRPIVDLMPGFADVVLNRSADGLAWLLAFFGVGAMASALWIAMRGKTEGLAQVFSINLFIGASSLLIFALSNNFWFALFVVTIFGFSSTTVSICSQTLIQHLVDGSMRARVMSLLGITFRAVPALGALSLGVGSSLFGLRAPIVTAAVLCLIAWVAFVYTLKRYNQSGEMEHSE